MPLTIITAEPVVASKSVKLPDMKPGFLFRGTFAGRTSVFLRTYDGLVDLDDPRSTWSANIRTLVAHDVVELKGTLTVSEIR